MFKSDTSILLKKWHEGDSGSLDTLLEQHLPWIREQVRRHMTSLLKSKGETLDYAQDVVIQFLRFAPRFRMASKNQFRVLLLRIVKTALLNKYDWFTARRRAISRERLLPSDTILCLDPPRGQVKTPSVSVESHENEAWVRLGMEFLNDEDREILVLRKWDDLPFAEIGKRLELSADAVRMRHNRAVRRLGELIWGLRNNTLEEILEKAPP
jgi:RNA polymerase sigma-70 factor, ECF subfamily